MVRNVIIKKLVKNTVCYLFSYVNRIIPKNDNIILLYSGNFGMEHNLKPLLEYLLKNGYSRKYRIICGIESIKYAGRKENNVSYVTHIPAFLYFLRSRHVFYTAGQIPIKPSKKQIVIHMNHGTCDYKTMGSLSNIRNGDEFFFTYMVTTGEYYRSIVAKEYCCKEENVFVCNEPTTDAFYKPVKEKYQFGKYRKILLWLPTFRQSEILNYSDSGEERLLPCFEEKDYGQLNEKLKECGFMLLVKLHTAQSLKKYQFSEYSNLKIYSNDDFISKGYDLYQLLMQVDALIGDYSSVSLQYLLLDKPMAYVIPDIDEYAKKRGFVFEHPEEFMPGEKIRTKEGFYSFLESLRKGKDPYAEKRKEIKKIIHKFDDGKACERLLELSEIRR